MNLGRHEREVELDLVNELTSGERNCESLLHMEVVECITKEGQDRGMKRSERKFKVEGRSQPTTTTELLIGSASSQLLPNVL
jgi:hypothetical protein